MHRVLVLGAGKIGALVSGLLAEAGDYQVQLADVNGETAGSVARAHDRRTLGSFTLDGTDAAALAHHLKEHPVDAVISSLPFHCNVAVARAARDHGLHYFDLTEDVEVTRAVRAIAEGAQTAFVPQCGLAPGFVSIAANELISHFDELQERQAARRRPAAASEQCPEVFADLVHRGPHQRIRQSLPCDRRPAPRRGRAARGARRDRDRRHAVRGIQHLGRPWLAWRDFRRALRADELQDDPLPGSLRAGAPADERPEAQPGSQHAEAHPRERRPADAAGCRHRVCRRHRPPGRRAARGKLRQQDLSAADCRPPVVGDPGHDRCRYYGRGGSGACEARRLPRLRPPGAVPAAGHPREPLRHLVPGWRRQGGRGAWWSRARPAASGISWESGDEQG